MTREDVLSELRQTILRLDMLSQVSAVNLDSSGGRDTSDDIGGRRPSGGIDRRDDRESDWVLKSADHFRRRMRNAHSLRTLEQILQEAREALAAATHQPPPDPAGEPRLDDPLWKRWVGSTSMPVAEIAWKYGVSRQYVVRVRERYG